ncbi:MAG: carbohydrate kinase [Aeromicrobium sp.]
MTILVIGEALVDVVEGVPHAGGSPFNVAVGLSRLECETVLATQIGNDSYGTILQRHLAESGVNLALLDPVLDRTSTATATIGEDGSASYEFDLTWDPTAMPDPAVFEAVHIGSLGAALMPGAHRVAELVATADAMGLAVSYDPNVRLAVEPDPAFWRAVFETVVPYVRILKMSDEDAAVLFPDEAPGDLAKRLAGEGKLVAITLGGAGAVVAGGPRVAGADAPSVAVVDTIGAGDSFMAAMLSWCAAYAWPAGDQLDETELTDLAEFSVAAAAITCSRPGADPPRLNEL